MFKQSKKLSIRLLVCLILTLMSLSLVQAQETSIEFPGEINAINGNIITVGGISVDVTNAILPADGLSVGMQVQVIGVPEGQTITATIVVITDFGTAPTPVPPPADVTATPIPTLPPPTAEQPTVEPTIMPTSDATIAPTQIVPTSEVGSEPIIVIEGPVQAINVSSITIFDIDIEVDSSASVLTQIRIGDTVRVEGVSSFGSDTIVIVAVDITIVQTTLVVIQNNIAGGVISIPSLPPSCKRTKNGKVTCKKKSSNKKSS